MEAMTRFDMPLSTVGRGIACFSRHWARERIEGRGEEGTLVRKRRP